MNPSKYQDVAYKQTEKRLYRYAVLCGRIAAHRKDIEELSDLNFDALQKSSKSFVSLIRGGMRMDPIDAHEAQIGRLKAYISADEYEARQIRRALRYIRQDPYYMIIECKYFRQMTDEAICDVVKCSLSTVRRNRTRLVKRIAEALYGMSEPTENDIA